jgi:predicted DNA-binding transcriptional regulator AlpA
MNTSSVDVAPTQVRRGYRRLEICEQWGVSTRTFDRLRAAGQIPPPDVKIGRLMLWSAETVARLFDSPVKARRK